MKKNKSHETPSLFDPEDKDINEKSQFVNILFTNVTTFGKTIARGLSLIAISYLAWRGAAEFFVTARNVSEAIALAVVGALLYIFLVK